jgi:hypothetical protein
MVRWPIRASRRRRMMANVRARLLKTPAEPSPELRISGAAAQTRVACPLRQPRFATSGRCRAID